jgi:hypothetical protein
MNSTGITGFVLGLILASIFWLYGMDPPKVEERIVLAPAAPCLPCPGLDDMQRTLDDIELEQRAEKRRRQLRELYP